MSIIEGIRAFFEKCPLISGGIVNVNYLGECGGAYAIENIPCEPIVKMYADGGSMRQFLFAFSSREYYDEALLSNMDISRFYEELSEWCETESLHGELPEIGEGKFAVRIEVKSSGYLMDAELRSARWQIQLRLVYIQDAV